MIISKTPLRASFFGGGTDFESYFKNCGTKYGSVLSAALDMHVYITINKKFDDMIRVVYSGNELVKNLSEVKHNIIREALKMTGITSGIEVIYMADLPLSGAGIGLASSSALAVGVLNALHAYKGEYVSASTLAKEACEIEINILGQRIGIQDQYAVAYGGFNRYRFLNDGEVTVTPLMIDAKKRELLYKNILLFFTGDTRDSSKILSEQSNNIDNKRKTLDDFVLTVDRVYDEISKGNIDIVGTELNRTWELKKSLSTGISNEKIDEMYTKAIKAGAIGGKILGAGGGGFMLLYVNDDKKEAVRKSLSDYKEVKFNVDGEGSRIVFVD